MPNDNLFVALRHGFPHPLDAVAVETADGPGAPLYYTWRDLDRGSAMLANLFTSLKLPKNSRVAVQVDKSVEALMLYLAVLRAGLIYLPLNTAYQAAEVDYFLADAKPAVVVACPSKANWVGDLARQHGAKQVYTLGIDRTGSLLDAALGHPDHQSPAVRHADDIACILYTSGTTGRSKGAMLTHANILSNARTLQTLWHWQDDDVLLHALPLFHIHGLFVALHAALLGGSKMIWFNQFDAEGVVARLKDASVFMGVPTLYVRMLAQDALTVEACADIRLFISGSAPLMRETFAAWQLRTGHTILERYGMSETVIIASNPYSPVSERKGGSVGYALPGTLVRIRNDEGHTCGAGEVGHIEVSGPGVFAGYWGMPDKTAEDIYTDKAGHRWFKTGDLGVLNDDDALTIAGRSKDLVISGGYNVFPAEVEAAINDLPHVHESAVVGVPHPDFGEAVIAIIVPEAGEPIDTEAVITDLKNRIANFKVPKRVFIVAALPRNVMGKVQKAVLREQHRALFSGA